MNNFKKLQSRTVYENEFVSVMEDTVLLPDGSHGIYSHIDVPSPSVAIIPVEKNGMYLIENYKYVIDKFMLEVPCGSSMNDESLIDAASRELQEETGFTAQSFHKLNTVFTLPFITNDSITYFIAQGLQKGPRNLDSTEIIKQPKFYTFAEMGKLIEENEIVQNVSLTAILLTMKYLKINF